MKFFLLFLVLAFSGCKGEPIDMVLHEVPDDNSGESRISWPGGESDWEALEDDSDLDTGSATAFPDSEELVDTDSYLCSDEDIETIGTGFLDTAYPLDSGSLFDDTQEEDTEPTSSDTGFIDTGSAGTESYEDTAEVTDSSSPGTDSGSIIEEYPPWEPNIDKDGYWGPYYPDTVVIYRNDLDKYKVGDFIDEDKDGFAWEEDCDDRNSQVFPGREEVFGNDIDDNCNCKVDEFPTDYEPTEDCPDNWWDRNFKSTYHTEWSLPGQYASSVEEVVRVCFDLGLGWNVPTFKVASRALIDLTGGVDPVTGELSDKKGSCWCDFPWGPGKCGPPVWVIGSTYPKPEVGVMRCDAYIPDILDTDGGYLPPNREIYDEAFVDGDIRVVCMRKMPNGIE